MSVIKFDDVVRDLGEFGPYQRRVYFLLCYNMFVAAFQKMIWVFIAASPLHRCRLPEDDYNNNTNPYDLPVDILNRSLPWNSKLHQWDACSKYVDDQDNDGRSIVQCGSWVFDNSQYKTSVVSDFGMVCDRRWMSAMTVSMQMGGEFVGGILLGILSDMYGRKRVMVISALMQTVVGVFTSLSMNVYILVGCRILIGFFTPGTVLSAYVIAMEFVGPSKRVFAGIVNQYFFGAGYLLVAVAAYFLRDWHKLQIALSVPTILIVSYWWLVPESVRWMLTKNKTGEALKVIKKVAKENGKQLTVDMFATEVVLERKMSSATLRDLFRHKNLRKRTLVVVFCWFVNTCVYYGFSYNTSNLGGNDYINFGLAAAVEFPAYTFCMFALDRFGRRIPLSGSMLVAGAALLVNAFVPSEYTIASVVMAMLGKLAITTSYAIIYMFSAEVFPTTVRSASYGLSSTCGRVGSMLAPFMLLLNAYWNPLPSMLFGSLALTSGFLCLLLPETYGRDLPDTIQEGENYEKMPKSTNTDLGLQLSTRQERYAHKLVDNGELQTPNPLFQTSSDSKGTS